jgi:hypothetical protein
MGPHEVGAAGEILEAGQEERDTSWFNGIDIDRPAAKEAGCRHAAR